jgi:hypothetical protein
MRQRPCVSPIARWRAATFASRALPRTVANRRKQACDSGFQLRPLNDARATAGPTPF